MDTAFLQRSRGIGWQRGLIAAVVVIQLLPLLSLGQLLAATVCALIVACGCCGFALKVPSKHWWLVQTSLGTILVVVEYGISIPSGLSFARSLSILLVALQATELIRPGMRHCVQSLVPGLALPTLLLLGFDADQLGTNSSSLRAGAVVCVWAIFVSLVDAKQLRLFMRGELLILSAVLATAAVGGWKLQGAISKHLPRLQVALSDSLRSPVSGVGAARSERWNATLSSVAFEKEYDPDRTAVIVYCAETPGYLRAAAYDTFIGEEWTVHTDRRNPYRRLAPTSTSYALPPPPEGIEKASAHRLFRLGHTDEGRFRRLDVINSPQRMQRYSVPLDAAYIEGYGSQVLVSEHGVLRGGLDTTQPYTVWTSPGAARSGPSQEMRARLLSIPAKLQPYLADALSQMPASQHSVRRKVAAVELYFRNNYKYSLDGFETPANQHSLAHFLTRRPPAHCEYFASAAVMLMRRQGIPARYVTGYLVIQRQADDEYWVGLNRHAHAWAEAYDEQRNQWVTVEATPGIHVPKSIDSGATSVADRERDEWDSAEQNNAALTNIASWRLPSILEINVFGGIMLSGGAVVGILLWRKKWRRSVRRSSVNFALREVDALVARRTLRRPPHQTLHQFAEHLRVHAVDIDDWLHLAADWYETTAENHYAGLRLDPPATDLLRSRAGDLTSRRTPKKKAVNDLR